jgi:hypothetical protein
MSIFRRLMCGPISAIERIVQSLADSGEIELDPLAG